MRGSVKRQKTGGKLFSKLGEKFMESSRQGSAMISRTFKKICPVVMGRRL